ncbi:DUF4194 domain-containing protein [Nocardia nepalensis]|uniref:DUF4194 domain-containing protein n=1 Tax=Nocardia nepalensis TaxID=3375448 RepID=UPI003B66CA50
MDPDDENADTIWDDESDEDSGTAGPYFDGDSGQLPLEVRQALVVLLKKRYVSAEAQPQTWRTLIENEALLRSRMNDLFLHLVVDRDYEIAYKRQAQPEANGRKFPTVLHDQAYGKEETLLLLHLRHLRRSIMSAGAEEVFVDHEDLLGEVSNYRPANSTNKVRDERATENAIANLISAHVLERTADGDRYRISPVVEVIMPVSKIEELYQWLLAGQGTSGVDSDFEVTEQ